MDRAEPQLDDLKNYAGRWVALVGNNVVGQGGTPDQALQIARASRHKENVQVIYVPTYPSLSFTTILEQVRPALPAKVPVYLVGGAVRDALLGKSVHDLDFVLPDKAISVARRVADKLRAAFFPLDDVRETGRVIITQPNGKRLILDFSNQRGPDLESDLRARDFTINAIAVDAHSAQSLLDPLGGVVDLREKRLRACSSTSFEADPLRIMRGIRLAAFFGFRIVPDTLFLMRQSVDQIARISPERIRDELFRILDGPSPHTAMRALKILGLLSHILPEIDSLKGVTQSPPHVSDVWEHTLGVLNKLEEILSILAPQFDPDKTASVYASVLTLKLGRYRDKFFEHLNTSLVPDRSRRALLFLTALYHDVGKPGTRQLDEDGRIQFIKHEQVGAVLFMERGKTLHLSNSELSHGDTVIANHLRPIFLAYSGEPPSRKAIYRFFRDTGSAGVDICLLSLADVWGTYGVELPQDVWTKQLDVVRALLEAWWEYPEERVSPPALLNGNELMREFGLKPGPIIGQILESIEEVQAIGQINSKEEAISFAQSFLNSPPE
jgi:putative nucleotidyltransferase with HDIG domain